MVGSKADSNTIEDIIEVVVVLPWVPEMAILFSYWSIIAPNSTERSIAGIFFFFASKSSGLSCEMAAVYTTKSCPEIFEALCPGKIVAPMAASLFVISDSVQSEPVIFTFLFIRISASPLMLIPPIPTM